MKLWDNMDDNKDDSEEENTITNSEDVKDILRNPSESQSSSRRYVAPTKEEFEDCLSETDLTWQIVDLDDVYEYVYESLEITPDDDVALRTYSTISTDTDIAREKGSDAIRLVMYDKETHRNMGGRKKTLRIKTYCKNLRKKIRSINNKTMEYIVQCDNCGNFMVIRNSDYGEFMGCRSYPDCENTQQVPDDI